MGCPQAKIDMISGGWLSGESACFTRKRSLVQIQYRPPVGPKRHRKWTQCRHQRGPRAYSGEMRSPPPMHLRAADSRLLQPPPPGVRQAYQPCVLHVHHVNKRSRSGRRIKLAGCRPPSRGVRYRQVDADVERLLLLRVTAKSRLLTLAIGFHLAGGPVVHPPGDPFELAAADGTDLLVDAPH